ncbi:MAG: zinc ABC transporter solute-binding protein [Nitrospiraceae bacterium]|nr:zinc ABC transporter solute-binding protein [Nitrospiraceae bacterium]
MTGNGTEWKRLIGAAAVLALAVVGCGERSEAIIAGTAHIEGIVRALSDSAQTVRCLIPPGMCPGHFDMRPSDIESVARGGLIILQPWQRELPNVKKLLDAANAAPNRIKVAAVEGSWMPPPRQMAGIERVAAILEAELPGQAEAIRAKATALIDRAQRLDEDLHRRLEQAEAGSVKTICNAMQADFLRWAGLEIVETYSRPEEMGIANMEYLVKRARASGAALVVDNLQSGETKMSAAVARDSGCVQVVLSNFPGGLADTETWEDAVTRNVELLLGAVEEWRRDNG